jgi:hypothetical protein
MDWEKAGRFALKEHQRTLVTSTDGIMHVSRASGTNALRGRPRTTEQVAHWRGPLQAVATAAGRCGADPRRGPHTMCGRDTLAQPRRSRGTSSQRSPARVSRRRLATWCPSSCRGFAAEPCRERGRTPFAPESPDVRRARRTIYPSISAWPAPSFRVDWNKHVSAQTAASSGWPPRSSLFTILVQAGGLQARNSLLIQLILCIKAL